MLSTQEIRLEEPVSFLVCGKHRTHERDLINLKNSNLSISMKVSSTIKLVTLMKYVKHLHTLGNFK